MLCIVFQRKQATVLILIILSVLFDSTKSCCFPCEWLHKLLKLRTTSPKQQPMAPVTIHCRPASPHQAKQSSMSQKRSSVVTQSISSPICQHSKQQLDEHCARMISVFPIQHSANQNPQFWEQYGINPNYEEIDAFLIHQCADRFEELNNSTTTFQKQTSSRSSRKELIVVDLDAIGCVLPKIDNLDAKAMELNNAETLRLNLLRNNMVIYKDHFLEFIHDFHYNRDY
eukprot:976365_1